MGRVQKRKGGQKLSPFDAEAAGVGVGEVVPKEKRESEWGLED